MSESRIRSFKNYGKDSAEARKKRTENIVELRKNRKDEQMSKRRNMPMMSEPAPQSVQQRKYDDSYIRNLAMSALSEDMTERHRAVQMARKLIAQPHSPPIEEVVRFGFVPILVESLKLTGYPQIQFEAAWALTNIASGTSEQTRIVVESGAVPLFIALLGGNDAHISEQCVWALGNIAGDGPLYRDYVINTGIIPPLLHWIEKSKHIPFLRTLAWTLSNLCRNKDPPPPLEAVFRLIPALVHLTKHSDREVKTDACWAFAFIADSTHKAVQLIVDSEIIPYIVGLLSSQDTRIILPSLRALGSVVAGSDLQTQVVLDSGFLPPLRSLLLHQKENIVREAVWALSNVTAGSKSQVQMVIDADLIPLVVDILRTRSFKTQKEAAWALCNMTAGNEPAHVQYLLKWNVIPPMCDLLVCQDTNVIMVLLDGIQNILKHAGTEEVKTIIEECGGLDNIEKLQGHENQEVYKLSFAIVDQHFQSLEDIDQTVAPQNEGQNYAFTGGKMPKDGFDF